MLAMCYCSCEHTKKDSGSEQCKSKDCLRIYIVRLQVDRECCRKYNNNGVSGSNNNCNNTKSNDYFQHAMQFFKWPTNLKQQMKSSYHSTVCTHRHYILKICAPCRETVFRTSEFTAFAPVETVIKYPASNGSTSLLLTYLIAWAYSINLTI